MPAFVVLNQPPANPSSFDLYVTLADTASEALKAVTQNRNLEGDVELNGKALSADETADLGLRPGEVRKL